jgi:chemotaxis protein MotB
METTRRKTRRRAEENQNADRWLLSYADLVTLLLALFIVLYAASDRERARKVAEIFDGARVFNGGNGVLPEVDSLISEREKIERVLIENPTLGKSAKVRRTSRGLVVSLTEAGFFRSGEAEINSEAGTLIDALAESLKSSDKPLRVEGHTDSTPISTARFPSNWELSSARASAVLARLIERGIAPERLSAAGFAGFQPIADNSTPEGRGQNRRVDLVIVTN